MFYTNPLEQFEVVQCFSIISGNISYPNFNLFLDFALTNITFFLSLGFIVIYWPLVKVLNKNYFILVQSSWQAVMEQVYLINLQILLQNAGKESQLLFPLFFTISNFLLIFNLLGMLPYGFTITSHLSVTFSISFILFIFFNIIGCYKHKLNYLSLFLPSGTPFIIMPFLFLIEVLSYLSRLFSLAIRLFANMMSGHTLLKILTTFIFSSCSMGSLYFLLNLVPIFILHFIILMEIAIAVLQVYVFFVLSAIYLKDVLYLH